MNEFLFLGSQVHFWSIHRYQYGGRERQVLNGNETSYLRENMYK